MDVIENDHHKFVGNGYIYNITIIRFWRMNWEYFFVSSIFLSNSGLYELTSLLKKATRWHVFNKNDYIQFHDCLHVCVCRDLVTTASVFSLFVSFLPSMSWYHDRIFAYQGLNVLCPMNQMSTITLIFIEYVFIEQISCPLMKWNWKCIEKCLFTDTDCSSLNMNSPLQWSTR